jgi:hypothetical protein
MTTKDVPYSLIEEWVRKSQFKINSEKNSEDTLSKLWEEMINKVLL